MFLSCHSSTCFHSSRIFYQNVVFYSQWQEQIKGLFNYKKVEYVFNLNQVRKDFEIDVSHLFNESIINITEQKQKVYDDIGVALAIIFDYCFPAICLKYKDVTNPFILWISFAKRIQGRMTRRRTVIRGIFKLIFLDGHVNWSPLSLITKL